MKSARSVSYENKYGGYAHKNWFLTWVKFPTTRGWKRTSYTRIFTTMKQFVNFMYHCDDYCLASWIGTTEVNQLFAFDLESNSGNHVLGTWLALKEEIRVGAFGLTPICAEYGLETLLSPTERNRKMVVDLQLNWTEIEQITWLATNNINRVYSLDVQPILLNIGSKHDSLRAKNLVYCITTYILSAVKMCTKHDRRQKKIVNWQSILSLSLLNMVRKHDSWQLIISPRPAAFPYYICSGKIIQAKWRNQCIGARDHVFLSWIWAWKLTRSFRRNLFIGARPTVYLC